MLLLGEKLTMKGFLRNHSMGFKDFPFNSELLKVIVDCEFEHPPTEILHSTETLGIVRGLQRHLIFLWAKIFFHQK